jgi:Fur family transcriptional regulator, peroxide stress response regulator
MKLATKPQARQTKYATAVYEILQEMKHATNLELLLKVQSQYPEVSATTIHRVTTRLKERGLIGCAPKPTNGSERYDITAEPHHHFVCANCSGICDLPETEEASQIIRQLKNLSDQCAFAGTLTLSGICTKCNREDVS